MGPQESRLERAASAGEYNAGDAFSALASTLDATADAYSSAAGDPGWWGPSSTAASALFVHQAERARANSDLLTKAPPVLARANAALREARSALHDLPDASLDPSIAVKIVAGSVFSFGGFGVVSSIAQLGRVAAVLAARREAAAGVANTKLATTLGALAEELLGLGASFTPPAPVAAGETGAGGTTADGKYSIGDPSQPSYEWDEHFEYDSKDANPGDWAAAAEWKAKLAGGSLLKRDLADALGAYGHYWDNNGEDYVFDYESGYENDSSIKDNVDAEIARSQAAAEEFIASGKQSFSFTGEPSASESYPETENWQKTIGGYQQWSSGDVTVKGDQATMKLTVQADDRYNFNRDQSDIATGEPDNTNGRFTEIGWAKPFDSSGTITRTVTWTIGEPGSTTTVDKPQAESR
jgi:hypothetical protein